ncbi:MAG TPA: MFS transporter [Acidimicrobiia bacterium]|nr:MFS transporter [Acidimicrobiia bacterium]
MDGLLTPRFLLAWAVSFFSGLAFFLFVHFPGFLADLGATEVQIGVVVGVTAFAALLIRPSIGRELDRRGRRPMILAGNAAHVIALSLYLTVHSFGPWLFAVRILHGFAEALVFASLFTYAADIVPDDRRTQGLALFGVSGMLPIAVGGVLGDFVLGRWSFTALFLTSLALGGIALILSLPLVESVTPAGRDAAVSFSRPLVQRDLLPIWWMTFVFSFSLTAYFAFLRTFVDETGIGSVGAFFGAYASAAILLRIFFGWLPDRVGQKRVLYPAMVAFAAGFLALAAAHSIVLVVVAGALCGTGHGYSFPILYAISFGRARRGDRGSASAIYTGLFDAGTLVGGPVLGSLITLVGYSTMFVIAAAWVTAGSLTFAIWEGDVRWRRTTPVSLG